MADTSNDAIYVHEKKGPSPPQTWKEALTFYCRKHHRIRASITGVMEETGERNYLDEWEVPWEVPKEVVTSKDDEQLQVTTTTSHDAGISSTSHSKQSIVGLWTKKLSEKISSAWNSYPHGDELYELPSGETDRDGIDNQNERSDAGKVALSSLAVDVSLARECLFAILEAIQTSSSSRHTFSKEPWTLMLRSSWISWLREESKDAFLSYLVREDAEWLLEVLIAQKKAKLWRREEKPDLVLFPSDKSLVNDDDATSKKGSEDSLQVPLALFDLKMATQSLEAQLESWGAQAQESARKALDYKKTQQTRMAVVQMARRKRLLKQIDDGSSKLIQLEQVYNSIETAHSNQSLVGLLSQGASLLRRLSEEVDLDLIDSVNDDLQDAMDQVAQDHAALTVSSTDNVDEDDLLAELASLTISDTVKETVSTKASPSSMSDDGAVVDTATTEDGQQELGKPELSM